MTWWPTGGCVWSAPRNLVTNLSFFFFFFFFVLPPHELNRWEDLFNKIYIGNKSGHASDRHSWSNNADTSCSNQLLSVHRVWNHSWSWKEIWGQEWWKSIFTFSQSTNSKARSKQNLMRSSPLNIRHSWLIWDGWSAKHPLHSKFIAWSIKQRTWLAVVLTSCNWASMVDWLQWWTTSPYISWCYCYIMGRPKPTMRSMPGMSELF